MQRAWRVCATAALLLAGPAWAQQTPQPPPPSRDQIATPGRPGWTVDARNGCWMWNQNPHPGETATWDGPCPRGPAEGTGAGIWRWSENGTPHIATFNGSQRNGRLDGRGVQTYFDGSSYDGEWRDGRPHGRGVYTFADGNRYDGEWRDGRPDGVGTYTSRFRTDSGVWTSGCFRDTRGNYAALMRSMSACP